MRSIAVRLITLALLVAPWSARAQNVQALRDSSEKLGRLIKVLHDSMVSSDSTATEVARHGKLVLSASANLRTDALAAFARFNDKREAMFGSAVPSQGGFRLVISTNPYGSGAPEQRGKVIVAGLPDTVDQARHAAGASPALLYQTLFDVYARMMVDAAPRLMTWLVFPWTSGCLRHSAADLAMYALVTGGGKIQRGCVTGDLSACAIALELRHSADSAKGPDFDMSMRADFFLTALETGGAGAWQRYLDESAPEIGSKIAAMAGMPIDSMVSRWRNGLMALRPIETPLSGHEAVLGLGWIVVVVAGMYGVSRWA